MLVAKSDDLNLSPRNHEQEGETNSAVSSDKHMCAGTPRHVYKDTNIVSACFILL